MTYDSLKQVRFLMVEIYVGVYGENEPSRSKSRVLKGKVVLDLQGIIIKKGSTDKRDTS